MIVEESLARTRDYIRQWRREGCRIGLVPTMGYFHAGHCALMKKARERADRVVVSLFVNPTQFGPTEDFSQYPRDMEGDCEKARQSGVDLLFCPRADEMYDRQDQTAVTVSELTKGLCGASRPGHFRGVTTVVSKLFNIVQPDFAVFGEKDYQQLAVIKRMVADLHIPVQVIGHPTVREPDGLAMSSRNVYLSAPERQAALILHKALQTVRQEASRPDGPRRTDELVAIGRQLIATEPLCRLDYFSVVDGSSLQEHEEITAGARALGAMVVGGRVRLIDNLELLPGRVEG